MTPLGSLALFAVLLKATLTSFSGFGSLPQIREDLVTRHHVVDDAVLNRAVLVARTIPGPMGVYVVSVGYEAAGLRGAVAGWLAFAMPSLLVLPLSSAAATVMHLPRVRGAISGLVLASAVLIVLAGVPLAAEVAAGWTRLLGW